MAQKINYRIAQNQKPVSGIDILSGADGQLLVAKDLVPESEIRVDNLHAYNHMSLYEVSITDEDEANTDFGRGMFLVARHGTHLLCGEAISRPQPVSNTPSADFSFSPSTGLTAGTEITFTDESNYDGLSVTRWIWSWGDNTPDTVAATAANVTHTFTGPGRYKVSLTIISNSGQGAKRSEYLLVGAA